MDDPLYRLTIALRGGAKRPSDLLRELNISQPTFSRLVSRAGDAVVSIGKARTTSYASVRDLRGLGSRLPIFRVTSEGVAQPWGDLRVLSAGQFGLETSDRRGGQLFDGLPYFLQDMRPQGFLGRLFPRANSDLHLPERITDWNDDDSLLALARRGEDCIGNIIVGDESLERFYRSLVMSPVPIQPEERAARYVELAKITMAGTPPGSSAGGEQPKFTTAVMRPEIGDAECVIVKFSPADDTIIGTRWRDLLIAEHHALETIRSSEFDAPRSNIVLADNRIFLEVARFDRIGIIGRRGVISLGAVDDEFFGKRDNWIKAVARLDAAKMISSSDARALRYLTVFGQLIGNTDQHFGNVSLIDAEPSDVPYRLAPVYDVLPMLYAPVNGEIVPRTFSPPMPTGETIDIWMLAMESANRYWVKLASDLRLSDNFRKIAVENAEILERLAPVTLSIATAPTIVSGSGGPSAPSMN